MAVCPVPFAPGGLWAAPRQPEGLWQCWAGRDTPASASTLGWQSCGLQIPKLIQNQVLGAGQTAGTVLRV